MKNMFRSRFHVVASLTFSTVLVAVPMLAANGSLVVKVKPKVAGVFVDNTYHGTAAKCSRRSHAISLPAGQHKVSIIDPRYQPLTKTVTITAGQTTVLRETLQPKPLAQPPFGRLKIKKGDRAAVYLNNAYYGEADEFNGPGQELLVKPGTYNLRVVPLHGGSPLEQKVTITANHTTVITMH